MHTGVHGPRYRDTSCPTLFAFRAYLDVGDEAARARPHVHDAGRWSQARHRRGHLPQALRGGGVRCVVGGAGVHGARKRVCENVVWGRVDVTGRHRRAHELIVHGLCMSMSMRA